MGPQSTDPYAHTLSYLFIPKGSFTVANPPTGMAQLFQMWDDTVVQANSQLQGPRLDVELRL